MVNFKDAQHPKDIILYAVFFKQAIDHHELPEKVVIDKSGANNAGLENINLLFFLAGFFMLSISFRSSTWIISLSKTIDLSKKSPDPCGF